MCVPLINDRAMAARRRRGGFGCDEWDYIHRRRRFPFRWFNGYPPRTDSPSWKLFHHQGALLFSWIYVTPNLSSLLVNCEFVIWYIWYGWMQKSIGSLTRMENLQGKVVVPGFIDSHVHFLFGGLQVLDIYILAFVKHTCGLWALVKTSFFLSISFELSPLYRRSNHFFYSLVAYTLSSFIK